jgi:glycosyltransferase involved in cell wall biosynthesis
MQYIYFKYVLPPILRSAKRIITVSEFTKSEVVKYYNINPEKITVIHHAADHFKPVQTFDVPPKEQAIKQWLESQQFFLTVGAFRAHKNVARIINAVESLEGNQKLIVVGAPNSYFNGLKEKYANKKDSRIHFLSYVSHELLGYLYKNCIANVYVSLYEGMGLPPYEVAVYNTVSIASRKTAIPEIYGDAVYYVDPENTEDIRKALELFSNNKIDKELYRSKFPALLNEYKWKHTAAKIAAVINSETKDSNSVKLMNTDIQVVSFNFISL